MKSLIGLKKDEFDVLVKEKAISLSPARLIPQTKSHSEMTLTSIFLSGLRLIDEFAKMFFTEAKMSRIGKTYVYTEVVFSDYENCRFDGLLIKVAGGKVKDATIFEMKNKTNLIQKDQIESYIEVAKALKIPRIVSVSNEFVSNPSQYPIPIKTPKSVNLFHFSWSYILTLAHVLLFDNSTNIEDEDQVRIMKEIVYYLESDMAGVSGFTKMKQGWKETVQKINSGAKLTLNDPCVLDTVTSWHQEEKDMALLLSRNLGLFVNLAASRQANNVKQLIEADKKLLKTKNRLTSKLRITDAVSDLTVSILFEKRTVEMMVQVTIPEDKTTRGQLGFVKTQLNTCAKREPESFDNIKENLFLGLNIKRKGVERYAFADIDKIHETLKSVELNNIQIFYVNDLGKQLFSQTEKFVTTLESNLLEFYKVIIQHLKNWDKPAPKIAEQKQQDE